MIDRRARRSKRRSAGMAELTRTPFGEIMPSAIDLSAVGV
jgi:hypothetical protein